MDARTFLINTFFSLSKIIGTLSHQKLELAELRNDREEALEYLKAAMKSLDNPNDRAAGLLALRTVAEATLDPREDPRHVSQRQAGSAIDEV